eukprot:2598703-Alexandrium_andersonii.AAC.1
MNIVDGTARAHGDGVNGLRRSCYLASRRARASERNPRRAKETVESPWLCWWDGCGWQNG